MSSNSQLPLSPLASTKEATRFWNWEKFPPWLASLVCHLLLVLVLAITVSQAMSPPPTELVVELQRGTGDGEPGGGGGELASLGEQLENLHASALDAAPLAEPLDTNPLAPQSELTSELNTESTELAGLHTADFGSETGSVFGDGLGGEGGGLGGGIGRGIGTGVGDGRGPGDGRTSVFSLVGEGQRFVYVFDRSESMNSVFTLYSQDAIVSQVSPLALAKEELLKSLDNLAEHHQFQIVFYNHDYVFFSARYGDAKLFPATAENKLLAREFVEAIPGEGNTNHWDALQAAMNLRPDVIFLITDGEAKDDPPLHRVQSMAKFCRRKHIQINVIHFSQTNRPDCTLIPLAEITRGQHLFIDLQASVRAQRQ